MKDTNDDFDLEDPDLVLVFDGVVKLTAFQFDQLLNKYQKKSVEEKIYSLSTGIHNENKQYLNYKDHYKTISNWLRKNGKLKTDLVIPYNSPIL